MSAGAAGGAAAAATAAAIAKATKASGVIVRVEPPDFLKIVAMNEQALVVHAQGGLFKTSYQYLTSYRGLAFFTKSADELALPRDCQVVRARKIWIPG
jgi:hypothetical protein